MKMTDLHGALLRNKAQREIKAARSTLYHTDIQKNKKENPATWFHQIKSLTSSKSTIFIKVDWLDPDNATLFEKKVLSRTIQGSLFFPHEGTISGAG